MRRSTSSSVVLFVLIFSIFGFFILKSREESGMNNERIYVQEGEILAEDISKYLGFNMNIYPVEIEDRGVKDIDRVLKSNIYLLGKDDFYKDYSNEYLIFFEWNDGEYYKFKVVLLEDYLKEEDGVILNGKINRAGEITIND